MSQYQLGHFVEYRATQHFHLGSVNNLEIFKDEIVSYDGTTLRVQGAEHVIPAIRGAIKNNWLVLATDTDFVLGKRSSGVEVHGATHTARDRGAKLDMSTRNNEHEDRGTIKSVRDRGDGTPQTRTAREEAARTSPAVKSTKFSVVDVEGSSEGVAVGKIARPAKPDSFTLTNDNVQSLTQRQMRLDDPRGSYSRLVEPIAHDVDGITGHQARVISNDQGGVRGQHAKVIASNEDIFGDQEAVVVGKASASNARPVNGDDEPYLTPNEKAERADKRRSFEAQPQGPVADTTADQGALPPDLAQKVSLVRAVIPNFEWNMARPWKSRVAEALRSYSKNPLFLNGILSVESDVVKTHIVKGLTPKA